MKLAVRRGRKKTFPSARCSPSVLAVLAVEEHRAGALDAGDGAIPKSHGAGDAGVEVGERGVGPGHVVGRAGVQDPARWVSIRRIVNIGLDLLLQDMELRERRR